MRWSIPLWLDLGMRSNELPVDAELGVRCRRGFQGDVVGGRNRYLVVPQPRGRVNALPQTGGWTADPALCGRGSLMPEPAGADHQDITGLDRASLPGKGCVEVSDGNLFVAHLVDGSADRVTIEADIDDQTSSGDPVFGDGLDAEIGLADDESCGVGVVVEAAIRVAEVSESVESGWTPA